MHDVDLHKLRSVVCVCTYVHAAYFFVLHQVRLTLVLIFYSSSEKTVGSDVFISLSRSRTELCFACFMSIKNFIFFVNCCTILELSFGLFSIEPGQIIAGTYRQLMEIPL